MLISADMAAESDQGPRDELAMLASALSAHARRLERRGQRKSLAPAAAETARASPLAPRVSPPTSALPGTPQRPLPIKESASEPQPATRLTDAAPKKPAQIALQAAEIQAREIRARAANCKDLTSLREAVAACTACSLCRTRKQTVFMDGSGRVPVMFVGEAPGASEDEQGVPFVGRAGALLTDIITKGMGLRREDVVIANVLKCRPPENRDPTDVEKTLCTPWLDRQIELIDPRVVIPLGGHASKHMLQSDSSLGGLRARVHERNGRKIVPTFHPAYLLRSPGEKAECWKDIQLAMVELGLARPEPRSGGPR